MEYSTPSSVPKARGYQQEMLDASLQNNIVTAMDTGSGKTHITVSCMKTEVALNELTGVKAHNDELQAEVNQLRATSQGRAMGQSEGHNHERQLMEEIEEAQLEQTRVLLRETEKGHAKEDSQIRLMKDSLEEAQKERAEVGVLLKQTDAALQDAIKGRTEAEEQLQQMKVAVREAKERQAEAEVQLKHLESAVQDANRDREQANSQMELLNKVLLGTIMRLIEAMAVKDEARAQLEQHVQTSEALIQEMKGRSDALREAEYVWLLLSELKGDHNGVNVQLDKIWECLCVLYRQNKKSINTANKDKLLEPMGSLTLRSTPSSSSPTEITLQASASHDHVDPPGGARGKKRAADDTTNASSNTKIVFLSPYFRLLSMALDLNSIPTEDIGTMGPRRTRAGASQGLRRTHKPKLRCKECGFGTYGNYRKDLRKGSGEVEGPICQLALFHEDIIFFASKLGSEMK
ncbi:hypothetical protein DFH11DRAFT_1544279 [Phellopilus nigrolimitatus]|nr:hypothetical protein DFH11DRAFT_1544279 [Phellopilus nigrolimitatus]